MTQDTVSNETGETTNVEEIAPSEMSLRDTLAAALNEHSDTPQEPVATDAATDQAAPETVAEAPAPQAQAPTHWPSEKREMFSKLPPEAQTFILDRHKEMESDYTRKTTELAEQRKPVEEFGKLFEPYKQKLELAGMTPAQVTRQLLAAQNVLEQNPIEGIKWLAQSYKVDLSTLLPKPEDEFSDPKVSALERELNQLKAQLQSREQEVQRQNAAEVNKVITDFASSKNADGTPKYPHFDSLKSLMGPMVAQGKTMEEAYSLAEYTLPEVRERIASEAAKAAQAEALKKAEDDRKAKAKDARTAGNVIRSRGTAVEDTTGKTSLRQELAKNLRESGGRI
jgi:hypothetical protein